MFKRKNLQNSVRAGALAVATAMTGMGTAGLSSTAGAVNIAADGLGEVMIFPYYTARNGFASFFNIINTSDETVLIKVRWNEGENSRDARDFNVILSPRDMWTVATAGSQGGGARAFTDDNSCTSPVLPVLPGSGGALTGTDFVPFAYTGANNDGGGQDLDRTREGYFTVFEMGVVEGVATGGTALGDRIIASAEHSNVGDNQGVPGAGDLDVAGAPTNCAFIDSQFTDANLAALRATVTEPQNVLKGRAVLIELSTGVAHGYDPIVLENFFSPQGIDNNDTADLVAAPSQRTPWMDSANPAVAFSVSNGQAVRNPSGIGTFDRGVDAVTDLLSRSAVINDYNITSGSETDWVVTFPTKGFYVDRRTAATDGLQFKLPANPTPVAGDRGDPLAPFQTAEVFKDLDTNPVDGRGDVSNSTGESCLPIGVTIWDREEFRSTDAVSGFSPVPPTGTGAELCKEANILSFGNSDIFGSKLRSSLFEDNVGGLPGLNGWSEVTFTGAGGTELPNSATAAITNGLPVVGMRLEARKNTRSAGKRYGFASDHAYRR